MKELFNHDLLKVEPSMIRKFNDFARQNGSELYLTLGEPDFPTPTPVKEAAITAINDNHTNYAATQGSLELRHAISQYEKVYTPEEILVTSGSTEAISLALSTILNPGDEVIILVPAYPLYRQFIQMRGATCIAIDTSENQFQLTAQMLEAAISDRTKAIIINSPNNPTGTILNQESINVIEDSILKHDIFAICDDVYNQLLFVENVATFSKAVKNRLLVCQSFSKPYAMTGWRIGYLMADKEFIEQAMKIHQYTVSCVTTFVQDAAIKALTIDTRTMNDSYKKRRDYTFDRLIAMGMDVTKPEGTFYIFPSIRQYRLNSWEFCERLLLEQKVALIPGIAFEADDFIRISFCVSEAVLEESLNRLKSFLVSLDDCFEQGHAII